MKVLSQRKYCIVLAAAIIALTSCHKEMMPVPRSSNTNTTKSQDKPVLLTEDEVMHTVAINVAAQYVKTSVNNNVLTLTYTEDASAALPNKGYDLSFSIRFNEDFSASSLSKYDYTTPGPNGTFTTNWRGNDLKVLNEVTKTDNVINSQPGVKLHLLRQITFTKKFTSETEAKSAQAVFLNIKTDVIRYSSYVIFGRDYPATTTSAPVVYIK